MTSASAGLSAGSSVSSSGRSEECMYRSSACQIPSRMAENATMIDIIEATRCIPVTTSDGCRLYLQRYKRAGAEDPVLIVHGASAASDTFRIGETQCLVRYLIEKDFDVWTLDWRASMHCVKPIYCENVQWSRDTRIFTVDAAAECDVPAAIATMRCLGVDPKKKIGIVAHCLGGGIVAQGIAQGFIRTEDVERVVLTALGLFYKGAVDNMLKAEDRSVEELLDSGQDLLHPTKKWARDLCDRDPGEGDWDPVVQRTYELWWKTPLRHDCGVKWCWRVSYMFGMPYHPDNIPKIHAS